MLTTRLQKVNLSLLLLFSSARSAAEESSPGSEAQPNGWREAGTGPGRLSLLPLHAGWLQWQCKDKERSEKLLPWCYYAYNVVVMEFCMVHVCWQVCIFSICCVHWGMCLLMNVIILCGCALEEIDPKGREKITITVPAQAHPMWTTQMMYSPFAGVGLCVSVTADSDLVVPATDVHQ